MFNGLEQEWFARRNLLNVVVKRQDRLDAPMTVMNDHWTYYARKVVEEVDGDLACTGGVGIEPWYDGRGSVPVWRPAYHGTWFYGLWNLLLSGQISPSYDEALGHEFNQLGALVYCSPRFDTAISYARAQNVFSDGVYHMCVLELRVDMTKRNKSKQAGGLQWTFPSGSVIIVGVWVCHNCGNPKGQMHLRFWTPEDECIPLQCEQVHEFPTRMIVWIVCILMFISRGVKNLLSSLFGLSFKNL